MVEFEVAPASGEIVLPGSGAGVVFHRCNAQSAAYHANALAHTTDGWIQLAYGGLPPTSDLQDACAAG